ncbi:F-box-like domain superfamily [Arabidopsis suecica]|uniref:Probable F-box protein At3g25550 n=2 Tax=Arabidopsis TaxID=3701 RepID=FB326_ARATH|nr:F-box family protein [Arabidopsis thaliana]Q9LSU8.2 RecName: Full=Probable F-box protein At3g25550 [Arabidopsis thaliana]AEE77025.1 F-box family protein [Arabidopsis thaliana]KAG7632528.1 F-box-like domain superfamily [Arabidopsis suecica]|eukprot:NP_566771.1 F-box family protein [Arabidopsis thaliana]
MIMHHGRESKRRRRQVIKIPNDDVLEEIIVRLPVKTLTRFQTVSKHWRHTIKSRNGSKPSIRYKTMRLEWSLSRLVGEEEYLTSKKHKERRILFSKSVDGLFCLYSGVDMKQPIMVINPDTRWSKKLPLARIQRKNYLDSNKVEFSRLGFGKDSVTGTYKLAVIPPPPNHGIKHENMSF